MKTIKLIRHSIAERVDVPTEQIPLSKEGFDLAKKKYVQADKCFCSPYLRAKQTASILFDSPKVIHDLHERIIGNSVSDFWYLQYSDYDYKNLNGESLNEVKKRMKNALNSVLLLTEDNQTSLVVSHATAICSYLLNYCHMDVVDPQRRIRRITYEEKIILEGNIEPLDGFVLTFENNNLKSIQFLKNE